MDPAQPRSFIDRVDHALNAMPEALHSISTNNQVQILDTPHVWGEPMTVDGVAERAKAAVQAMADLIEEMIAGAQEKIDILSLNPADGVFLTAIKQGLRKLVEAGRSVRIRFLFGWVPTRDTVTAFRNDLAAFCHEISVSVGQISIVVGQYYSYKAMFWNHAKIVAADGKVALVGGHNLWDSAYGGYPPVHDISVCVTGDAAEGAHGYAEFLWRNAGTYLVIWELTAKYKFIELSGSSASPTISADGDINLADFSVVRGPSRLRSSEREPSASRQSSMKWPLAGAGRVMALGRCGGLDNGAYNASDEAKRVIILNARTSLKFCQQDLMFLGTTSPQRHQVAQWIAQALVQNPALVVEIVVSPVDASGAGDQYSWGSGAAGTHAALCAMIRTIAPGIQASEVIGRLHVAPFCFTPVAFEAEGVDYQWPAVPKELWAGRFGTTVPTPSVQKYNPAPGNHAKVFIADDSVCYIGSDNLYPHNLAEFGYLIEGEPVAALLQHYWAQVWKYSMPHRIGRQPSATFATSAPPIDPRVAQRNAQIRAKSDEMYEL